MAAKMSQEQKDFNKSKRGLEKVLKDLKWTTVDAGDKGRVQSAMDTAKNEIQPLIRDSFMADLENVGPGKRKLIQAYLAGDATIKRKK